jgi:hypothetical protein
MLCSFRILDLSVGWPGSMGDSTVFGHTPLCQALDEPNDDGWCAFLPPHCFIVGDGAYKYVKVLRVSYRKALEAYAAWAAF